jgi:sn-glycerol 3-phosphate transport system ATP-binding protein
LGANTLLHGKVEGTNESFTASMQGVHLLTDKNTHIRFGIQPGKSHLFDVETGLRRVG